MAQSFKLPHLIKTSQIFPYPWYPRIFGTHVVKPMNFFPIFTYTSYITYISFYISIKQNVLFIIPYMINYPQIYTHFKLFLFRNYADFF